MCACPCKSNPWLDINWQHTLTQLSLDAPLQQQRQQKQLSISSGQLSVQLTVCASVLVCVRVSMQGVVRILLTWNTPLRTELKVLTNSCSAQWAKQVWTLVEAT